MSIDDFVCLSVFVGVPLFILYGIPALVEFLYF